MGAITTRFFNVTPRIAIASNRSAIEPLTCFTVITAEYHGTGSIKSHRSLAKLFYLRSAIDHTSGQTTAAANPGKPDPKIQHLGGLSIV